MSVEISEEENICWQAKTDAAIAEMNYWKEKLRKLERGDESSEQEYWSLRSTFLENGDDRAI